MNRNDHCDLCVSAAVTLVESKIQNPKSKIQNRAPRRGGVLLEVLLSLALFGGAALFTLSAVRSVFLTLDRTSREQQAVDLARSTMAELEAGLITIVQLRSQWLGDGEAVGGTGEAGASQRDRWRIRAAVQRSAFSGLSLVELTVEENTPDSAQAQQARVRYTLRQLVRLRPEDGDVVDEGPPLQSRG